MRAKRSKQYKKLMTKYSQSFGHRPPYQVLIDAQIIQDAAKFKMNLGARLEDTLSDEIKPMITQCCIRHLYALPTTTPVEQAQKEAWISVAKAAERRRCDHHELDEPLSALDCLKSVVDPKGSGTNKHRYAVASQDLQVRHTMRGIAGVPLVYINRSVMILEPMAGATEDVREREERSKVKAGLKGRRSAQIGDKRKRKREDEENTAPDMRDGEAEPVRKRAKVKGPKAPNPLSVKKKKKDSERKTAPRDVKYEQPVTRKAEKRDLQAVNTGLGTAADIERVDGTTEAPRKRKRKRKQRDDEDVVIDGVGAEHE